jgi:hypothetical protein
MLLMLHLHVVGIFPHLHLNALPPFILIWHDRDLSENKLEEVPPESLQGLGMKSLTRLDLHSNELHMVPSELFKLPNLKQL